MEDAPDLESGVLENETCSEEAQELYYNCDLLARLFATLRGYLQMLREGELIGPVLFAMASSDPLLCASIAKSKHKVFGKVHRDFLRHEAIHNLADLAPKGFREK